MFQKIKTAIKYTRNIFVTGAIVETNKQVEDEITSRIPNEDNLVIIEFGMGHGNITKAILSKIGPNSKVYAFEVHKPFCEHAEKHITDKRLTIINDGAENVNKYVSEDVDSIISSIPFSFFSEEMKSNILKSAYGILKNKGYMSQVLLSAFHFRKYKSVFDNCKRRKILNFPIYHIYHCQKETKKT
jgi:phospholipid N-methyltransferase